MPLHHWPRRNLRIYKGAQLSFYDPPHFELANLHDLNQHPALHLYHLEQIYQSDQDKGHLDKKSDRKGKRPDWDKWILFLMEKGYLTPHILETKTKPKTVYLLAK